MDEFIQNQPTTKVYGLPSAGDLTDINVDQGYPSSCAVRSQELVLRDFGIDVPQEQLMQEGIEHGWFDPNTGTAPNNVGKLLELHGIAVTRYDNSNVYDLVNELASGKKIIVGVDAGELWTPGWAEAMEDNVIGTRPDHALIVAGIDTTDPDNVQVILTDPGTGHVAKAYPLDQFLDAWNDSGNMMCVTNAPAPASAPGMVNFDYNTGHMPIGDMPYETWAANYSDKFTFPAYVSADLNGDGIVDSYTYDFDQNGHPEFMTFDTTGNGNIDMIISQNGTGTQIAMDLNGDGIPDLAGTDDNSDGILDTMTELV